MSWSRRWHYRRPTLRFNRPMTEHGSCGFGNSMGNTSVSRYHSVLFFLFCSTLTLTSRYVPVPDVVTRLTQDPPSHSLRRAPNTRSASRQVFIGISFFSVSRHSSRVCSASLPRMVILLRKSCVLLTLASGLIPQAPLHTASLVVLGYKDSPPVSFDMTVATPANPGVSLDGDDHALQLSDMEDGIASARPKGNTTGAFRRRLGLNKQKSRTSPDAGKNELPVAVVEQRVSNLAQGSLCEPISFF